MIKRNWNQCRKMDVPWPWGQDTWIFFLTVISSSHLVKTLLFQPFAKNFSDACKSHDRFFTHGLSHKIFMFLGCWRHGCFRVCFKSLSEMKWNVFCSRVSLRGKRLLNDLADYGLFRRDIQDPGVVASVEAAEFKKDCTSYSVPVV